MRTSVWSLQVILAVGLMNGCTSGSGTQTAGSAAARPESATKVCEMHAGGVKVLRLTTSADVNSVAADGSLHFTAPQYEVEFWLVSGAKTVEAGIAILPTQIVSEFKDFKAERIIDLAVAGSAAKRLVGTGHEADDGDPGDADVIVFKVGDHIFIACTHGESLNPSAQAGMLEITQTAQVP